MCNVEGHCCPFLSDRSWVIFLKYSIVQGNSVDGHDVQHVPWGLRDGMDRLENCAKGHHGMSLDVPHVPWGLRDEMDT